MVVTLMQKAFTAGVLSPELIARVDIEAYQKGAAELYNVFVDYKGGALNRSGTQFCAPANHVAGVSFGIDNEDFYPLLMPFIFEQDQSLVLVFGHEKLRFISDGGYVLQTQKNITGLSKADPGRVTATGHGYSDNDLVYIDQVGGMTQVNDRYFEVTNDDANHFFIGSPYENNAPVDTTGYSTYTSGGRARRVYTLATPYAQEDLWSLKFVQARNVIYITSLLYEPQILTRISNTNWTIAAVNFESSTAAPANPTLTPSFTGSGTGYRYVITATSKATGVESEASADADDSLNYWPTSTDNIKVEWDSVTGAAFYSVYRAPVVPGRPVPNNALNGLIGQTRGLIFNDHQVAPDFSLTPPVQTDPFDSSTMYPACVTFVQQRLAFAQTSDKPFRCWTTPVGDFSSMARSLPPRDTDSLEFELASQRADPIVNLLAMPAGMLAFTTEAVYHVYGGGDGSPLTPNNINSDPVVKFGASDLAPLAIGNHVLYTQAEGGLIRDVTYNFFAANYDSTDLTLLASFLFKDFRILRWAYSNHPYKVVWAIRDDGRMLSLTYVPEQNIFAYGLHETNGVFRDVCVIPENGEDVPYFCILRGRLSVLDAKRYYSIERMKSRQIVTIEDAWFLDNAVATSLPEPDADLYFINNDTIATTQGSFTFSSAHEGRIIRVGGGMLRITDVPAPGFAEFEVLRPVTNTYPDGTYRVAPSGTWYLSVPVTTFRGLFNYFDGEEVYGLADGFVVGPLEVEDGQVVLEEAASYAVFGTRFDAKIKSLRLDVDTQEGTTQGSQKTIPAVTVRVCDSRGVELGQDYDSTEEDNSRSNEPLGQPPALFTGDQRVIIDSDWNVEGQIVAIQRQPLPMQILGWMPEIVLGDN